jgi:hypothetical protein
MASPISPRLRNPPPREAPSIFCRISPPRSTDVSIYFCFLDGLKDRGPFAPIFYAVGEPHQAVNWIGEGGGSKQ